MSLCLARHKPAGKLRALPDGDPTRQSDADGGVDRPRR